MVSWAENVFRARVFSAAVTRDWVGCDFFFMRACLEQGPCLMFSRFTLRRRHQSFLCFLRALQEFCAHMSLGGLRRPWTPVTGILGWKMANISSPSSRADRSLLIVSLILLVWTQVNGFLFFFPVKIVRFEIVVLLCRVPVGTLCFSWCS